MKTSLREARKVVWDSLLDADMNVRYWAYLSRRYHGIHLRAEIFLSLMASGVVACWKLWGAVPEVWQVLSVVTAALAIAIPILAFPRKVERVIDLRQEWSRILADYEILWMSFSRKNESQIAKEYKRIRRCETERIRGEAAFPHKRRWIRKCQRDVREARGLPGKEAKEDKHA